MNALETLLSSNEVDLISLVSNSTCLSLLLTSGRVFSHVFPKVLEKLSSLKWKTPVTQIFPSPIASLCYLHSHSPQVLSKVKIPQVILIQLLFNEVQAGRSTSLQTLHCLGVKFDIPLMSDIYGPHTSCYIMQTALYVACTLATDTTTSLLVSDREAVVTELLRLGAGPRTRQDVTQVTPLDIAAKAGNSTLVGILLDALLRSLPTNEEYSVEEILEIGRTMDYPSWAITHALVAYNEWRKLEKYALVGCSVNSLTEEGDTPLRVAAILGLEDAVAELIRLGARVDTTDAMGSTPLHKAATFGHLGVVKLLTTRAVNLDAWGSRVGTPLLQAVENGHLPVVDFLVQQGANIFAEDGAGRNGLYFAVTKGNLEMAAYLVDRRLDVNKPGKASLPPIFHACRKGNLEMVAWLVEKGADINFESATRRTPLSVTVERGWTDLTRWLLERGAIAPTVSYLLCVAAECSKSEDMIRLLVENGAHFHERNSAGLTALEIAVNMQWARGVDLLLDAGAEVNLKSDNSPLHIAADKNNVQIMQLLLDKGANIEGINVLGLTPLQAAANADAEFAITELISRGAELEGKGKVGASALQVAAYKGKTSAARRLLEYGATTSTTSPNNETPLHSAAHGGYLDTVRLLLEFGAQADARTANLGASPLHFAVRFGHYDVVKVLLEHGADINATGPHARPPLCKALTRGHLSVAKLLVLMGADIPFAERSSRNRSLLRDVTLDVEIVMMLLDRGVQVTEAILEYAECLGWSHIAGVLEAHLEKLGVKRVPKEELQYTSLVGFF